MAIPAKVQPTTPYRTLRGFTVGTGPRTPATSSTATSMNTGGLNATPPRINTLGVDSASRAVSIPVLAPGQTFRVQIAIPLPNLPGLTGSALAGGVVPGPTASAPLVSRPVDTVTFLANLQIANSISGLAVQHFEATPRGHVSGQAYQGPKLQGGLNYTSFSVLATVIFTATTGTSAGVVKLTANGHLTLQSG